MLEEEDAAAADCLLSSITSGQHSPLNKHKYRNPSDTYSLRILVCKFNNILGKKAAENINHSSYDNDIQIELSGQEKGWGWVVKQLTQHR